jgi:hypothetical protein
VKMSSHFALPLAALLFVFLLVPRAAMAGSADCPTEPKSNVPIASGDVYAGTNCTLNTTGDVDSFVFNADAGDIYQLSAGINTGSEILCMTLYDPSATQIFYGCNNYPDGGTSIVTEQTLAATGTYTMVLTEAGTNGPLNYGTSLERIYPTPTDAKKATLGTAITGTIAPLADTPAFTFAGVTTGDFEVAVGDTSGSYESLCITVYSPTGAVAKPDTGYTNPACNNIADGVYNMQVHFTPTQAGTYLVLLDDNVFPGSYGYTFEVSCLVGNCVPPPPSCSLADTATYSATTSTLTMDFTVENSYASTWNAWLIYQNTTKKLFSVAQPITSPAVSVIKTASVPAEGEVEVLSTLVTSTKGIVCSSLVKVATGTP